ncbi:tail fiber protein [Escherichia coli phage vB_EcoS_Ace]|uniref:Tail fiber protein n=1 Tax=Escherichia coli phage vB_EcoS_Ace TaxID=2769806 RepID=A0A7H0XBG7_9CAUD|nr:tail fiber protein [Escherichia coli phage vB_EcoS_Ace]
MSRQLMPKSGAMAPYVVVNRDAAVAGVFSVDGEAGAVVLTSKYLQLTKYTTDKTATDAYINSINESIGNINTAIGGINTNLGTKAAKGANNDITELNALTKAITIAQGGTGASTLLEAKTALQIDRLRQQDNGTFITSPDGKYSLFVYNSGDFGLINSSTAAVQAMKVQFGGTGASDAKTARKNLDVPVGATAVPIPPNSNVLGFIGATGQSGYYSSGNLITFGPPVDEDWWTFNFHCHSTDIDGFAQYGILKAVGKSGSSWLTILNGTGNWLPWQKQFNGQSTVPITNGGTGATTVAKARENLLVDQVDRAGEQSMLWAPDKDTYFFVYAAGDWGVYDKSAAIRKPLPIASGGTGGTDVNTARNNLSLGTRQQVIFDSVYLPDYKGGDWSYGYGCKINGGALSSWSYRPVAVSVDGNTTDVAVGIAKVTIPGKGYACNVDGILWGDGTSELDIMTGASRFYFHSDGGARASNWINVSDIRTKSNLTKIEDSLSKVKLLCGYTYQKRTNIDDPESKDYSMEAGIIAQDLQKVLPEAVYQVSQDGYLGVSYGGVSALLVSAVNELNGIVEQQRQEIDELKELVKQLLTK